MTMADAMNFIQCMDIQYIATPEGCDLQEFGENSIWFAAVSRNAAMEACGQLLAQGRVAHVFRHGTRFSVRVSFAVSK